MVITFEPMSSINTKQVVAEKPKPTVQTKDEVDIMRKAWESEYSIQLSKGTRLHALVNKALEKFIRCVRPDPL